MDEFERKLIENLDNDDELSDNDKAEIYRAEMDEREAQEQWEDEQSRW